MVFWKNPKHLCAYNFGFFFNGAVFSSTKKNKHKKKRKSEREREREKKKKAWVLLCARVGYIP